MVYLSLGAEKRVETDRDSSELETSPVTARFSSSRPLEGAPQSRPVLSLPSYDAAYRRFLEDVYQGFVADNEVLGAIELVRDRHAGPVRNIRDTEPLDQPMTSASGAMTLVRAACRATEVSAHTEMIQQFAEEMIGEQTRLFFAHMNAICEATGNVFPNIGEGTPTLEQWRVLFQRVDLDFDDDGRLQQRIYVHPSQAEKANEIWRQVQNDPECVRIVTEKRAQWMERRAARSRRTLSR